MFGLLNLSFLWQLPYIHIVAVPMRMVKEVLHFTPGLVRVDHSLHTITGCELKVVTK